MFRAPPVSGLKSGERSDFSLGRRRELHPDPTDFRPLRLAKKIKAGANFIQTQLVYDVKEFAKYMEKVRELGVHKEAYILAGVGPLKSPGMAKYMKNRVPGMDVPDEIVKRLSDTPKEKQGDEGIKICIESIQELKEVEGVKGFHVMAIEWEEKVPGIVKEAGLYPRPEG